MRVRINPNSQSANVKGVFAHPDGDCLKVSVVSVPEKGKANKELINMLAKKMALSKSSFEVVAGITERYKKILIIGDVDMLTNKIKKLIDEVE